MLPLVWIFSSGLHKSGASTDLHLSDSTYLVIHQTTQTPQTRQVQHVSGEQFGKYSSSWLTPIFRNSNLHCYTFSWKLFSKCFPEVRTDIARFLWFVLIPDLNSKVCFVRFLQFYRCSYIMLFTSCLDKFTAYITK